MNGRPAVWRRVRILESQRSPATWTGPLPIVCPQEWAAADCAAWETAQAAGDEAMMDALIERHAGVRQLPPEAGIRCIVIAHLPPRGDDAWDGWADGWSACAPDSNRCPIRSSRSTRGR